MSAHIALVDRSSAFVRKQKGHRSSPKTSSGSEGDTTRWITANNPRLRNPPETPPYIFTPPFATPPTEVKSRGFCHRVGYDLLGGSFAKGKLTKPLFFLGYVVWNNKKKGVRGGRGGSPGVEQDRVHV